MVRYRIGKFTDCKRCGNVVLRSEVNELGICRLCIREMDLDELQVMSRALKGVRKRG